jgi:hypothetical protein
MENIAAGEIIIGLCGMALCIGKTGFADDGLKRSP